MRRASKYKVGPKALIYLRKGSIENSEKSNNDRREKKVAVIIPTLNEGKTIGGVIRKMPKKILEKMGYKLEVLVVDGGSKDNTREIAKSLGAKVIVEKRKGYGQAYLTGLKIVDADIIVTMDGDGTYPPETIPVLVRIIEQYGVEFLSANRLVYYSPGAFVARNLAGNKVLNLVAKLLFFLPFEDSQSGMWVMTRDFIKKLRLGEAGMAFSTEIKIEAWRIAKKVAEVPVYFERRLGGESKIKWYKDGIQIIMFMLRRWGRGIFEKLRILEKKTP